MTALPTSAALPLDGARLPAGDYVSPNLEIVRLDDAFPNMIAGETTSSDWPYLRGEFSHNWYVDGRDPTVGFLSRDEASILYNTACMFRGVPCLEIGCWRGWSTAHLALGSGALEVIDPVLEDPTFREDVMASLRRAGVLDRVLLHPGASPEEVVRISASAGKRWAMVFIDGDHEGDAPRRDAETVERYAADDALILLHDLVSPDVTAALEYLREQGWRTAIYQTMQIMGVAVRGAIRPIAHIPDPSQPWVLPAHLASFPVIGESRGTRLSRITSILAADRAVRNTEHDLSAFDSLPEDVTAALDSLLRRAGEVAGRLASDGLIAEKRDIRAFDKLQRQHLRLLDNLQKTESAVQKDAFELLHLKYLDLNQRLADAKVARDSLSAQLAAAQRAGEEAARELREAIRERDVYGRLLDRALVRANECEQARIAADRARDDLVRRTGEPGAHIAIRQFSYWIARKRVLFGLSRRLLLGRIAQVQAIIEQNLRECRVPESVVNGKIGWLSRPRVILGLARRCALAGTNAVQGLVVMIMESALDPVQSLPSWASEQLYQFEHTIKDLEKRLAAEARRFQALEAAKLEDERALLEAQLAVAKLRGPIVTSTA